MSIDHWRALSTIEMFEWNLIAFLAFRIFVLGHAVRSSLSRSRSS